MRKIALSLLLAASALLAQGADPEAPQTGGLRAALYFGMKASNYYRDKTEGDNFFGQRGFFLVETQREWSQAGLGKQAVQLFGSISVEGKRQSEYTPEGSSGVLDYTRKVVKETGGYSAEVGLRHGLWGGPEARFFLVASATFRNSSLRDEPVNGGAPNPALSYSDRSRATNKFGVQIRTEDSNSEFFGSFLETAFLKDEFYDQAQRRLLLRGRLAVKINWMKGLVPGSSPTKTGGYFIEGAINRGITRTLIQEKDESIVMVGLQFHF
ncbi:MAG: hypothetical protein HYZ13_13485 [Acidobacteria bacterium]|nr:hypothetical protein [Acidobacteriota bacterium]